MWQDTNIEKYFKTGLYSTFNTQDADMYFSLYIQAKDFLCKNIYSEIKGKEPGLTDHSERHVKNVLDFAWKLISYNDFVKDFNIIEIYLLCTCILFHDAGNLHGREEHNKKVADIYNVIRSASMTNCKQERQLLLRIIKAHCGKSAKGDKDTLLDIEVNNNLYDYQIKVRDLAAILRFADELAEGPQRTSQYMIDRGMIQEKSLLYHKYATSINEIHVDKGNGRIVLSYNIDCPVEDVTFKDLMQFVYTRIIKLDTERRYCKYYASSLDVLKKTEASINFTIYGDLCDYNLPTICLEDKYSLVDESIDEINSRPGFNIETVDKNIQEKINNHKQ